LITERLNVFNAKTLIIFETKLLNGGCYIRLGEGRIGTEKRKRERERERERQRGREENNVSKGKVKKKEIYIRR
jgi:hypothetical protein